MSLFVQVRKDTYFDSIQVLVATDSLYEADGIQNAKVAMATDANKADFEAAGLMSQEVANAAPGDLVIAAQAESREAFERALALVDEAGSDLSCEKRGQAYKTFDQAIAAHPEANICLISVPGEYAKMECEKALQAGLHIMLFSASVPPQDELYIKELAREKGLLCMGPDCGVVNLNGVAFILASINNRGPFGICGASGCGIQHVSALLHANGSGITQGIGTGGGDLKAPVYGITMLMGIDALENDPQTKYIILVSRKPNEISLQRVLNRISTCKKPVVVCFMGCDREPIEAAGGIYASSLDDAAVQAMKLIGGKVALMDDEEIDAMAAEAVAGMSNKQKYVRGLFDGGTYCDEAIGVLEGYVGKVHSNVASSEELRLQDSMRSVENTCVDYGEEEFTQGRPHPTMWPAVREEHICREGCHEDVAVLLFDFINTPAAPKDILSGHILEIRKAMAWHQERGGKLAVVASICGTDADFQGLNEQKKALREAGVLVCPTNYTAAKLAGKIIALKNGGRA